MEEEDVCMYVYVGPTVGSAGLSGDACFRMIVYIEMLCSGVFKLSDTHTVSVKRAQKQQNLKKAILRP